jgi:hypothetical protein
MLVKKIVSKFFMVSLLAYSSMALAGDEGYETAAKQLQQRLGKVLMSTIQTEGHIAAIGVCNEQAPQIASAVSEELGLIVGRTALKVRNLDNSPSADQKRILEDFKHLWNKNKENPPTATYTDDGGEVWMKAIVMQPQCLACHGSSVEPELQQAINERYPNDRATGFEVGDIRGAFVVKSKNQD